jgi:hypothetical protein
VPVVIARSLGVLGAFVLMAIFHIYALSPILNREGLIRIGVFFMLNGIATVSEAAIWGHENHCKCFGPRPICVMAFLRDNLHRVITKFPHHAGSKAAMAWTCETILATWTASGLNIPNGLSRVPWRELCDAPSY